MNLHKRWLQEKQVMPFEVVTLVTLGAEEAAVDGALLVLTDPDERSADPADAQFSIRIAGETFLPEHEPAKKVLLREEPHRCDSEVRWLRAFAGKGVFDLYRRPTISPSKPRAIFVDGEKLLAESEFSNWLNRQAQRRVKASTQFIVHQDDAASKLLAAELLKVAAEALGLTDLKLISQSDLADVEMPKDAGVVICAAVVGKGSRLLEISRALRDKDCGARLYVVGFQVTDSREELTALTQNLQHDKVVKHEFTAFGSIAVGRQLGATFADEVRRYRLVGVEASAYPGVLGRRIETLAEVEPVGQLGLLPHGDEASQPLRLRETFAFWEEGYAAGPCHAEVLATIAVILQRAREDRKLAERDRLATSTYRHVALHPDNFSRFNDGVVQAALLRCAYPSELDYRDDNAASDFLKGLILRALNRGADEAGEGILEFIFALASKRLQLVDEHRREVFDAARSATHLGEPLRRAINFLINPRGGAISAGETSPI